MHYTGENFRPPTEAYTPLLEVTIGCSYNKCSFCTMYRQTRFRMAPEEHIIEDLQELSQYADRINRIYLLNGDPFVLSASKLLHIADLIHQYLPNVNTISCYCSIRDLMTKTNEEMLQLKEAGYDDLYIGIESADGPTLEMINKGCNSDDVFREVRKLENAGMHYIGIYILGIGGKARTKEHVEATAKLFNETHPRIIGAMSLSIEKGSELEDIEKKGNFQQLTEGEVLEEEIAMLEALNPRQDITFWAAHVFDRTPIAGPLTDKKNMISLLRKSLDEMPEKERNGITERGHI